MSGSGESILDPVVYRFAQPGHWGMKAFVNRGADMTEAQRSRAELVELLHRVASRDSAALRAVYDRTSAKLYGICLRVLGNETEAQDVLQEIYVAIWNKAAKFDEDKASPITWLAVIARNKAIDFARARRFHTDDVEAATQIPDESPSAIEILEAEQDSVRLADCLSQLEERARAMIRRAFFEGVTYPELATQEGVPLPTMKSWIRRGLLRLRGCMER